MSVREAFVTRLRSDVGFASATPPPEEEEPRVVTYAAADGFGLNGVGSQTETATAVPVVAVSSVGGGRVLRMCRCLEEDAV